MDVEEVAWFGANDFRGMRRGRRLGVFSRLGSIHSSRCQLAQEDCVARVVPDRDPSRGGAAEHHRLVQMLYKVVDPTCRVSERQDVVRESERIGAGMRSKAINLCLSG